MQSQRNADIGRVDPSRSSMKLPGGISEVASSFTSNLLGQESVILTQFLILIGYFVAAAAAFNFAVAWCALATDVSPMIVTSKMQFS
jgi:multisubunit Na+/H+ antiporter MnhE subunit